LGITFVRHPEGYGWSLNELESLGVNTNMTSKVSAIDRTEQEVRDKIIKKWFHHIFGDCLGKSIFLFLSSTGIDRNCYDGHYHTIFSRHLLLFILIGNDYCAFHDP
jgi:hypothetical protein